MAEPKTTVTVRMPPEIYLRLVKEASNQGVSLNALIIELIIENPDYQLFAS